MNIYSKCHLGSYGSTLIINTYIHNNKYKNRSILIINAYVTAEAFMYFDLPYYPSKFLHIILGRLVYTLCGVKRFRPYLSWSLITSCATEVGSPTTRNFAITLEIKKSTCCAYWPADTSKQWPKNTEMLKKMWERKKCYVNPFIMIFLGIILHAIELV